MGVFLGAYFTADTEVGLPHMRGGVSFNVFALDAADSPFKSMILLNSCRKQVLLSEIISPNVATYSAVSRCINQLLDSLLNCFATSVALNHASFVNETVIALLYDAVMIFCDILIPILISYVNLPEGSS